MNSHQWCLALAICVWFASAALGEPAQSTREDPRLSELVRQTKPHLHSGNPQVLAALLDGIESARQMPLSSSRTTLVVSQLQLSARRFCLAINWQVHATAFDALKPHLERASASHASQVSSAAAVALAHAPHRAGLLSLLQIAENRAAPPINRCNAIFAVAEMGHRAGIDALHRLTMLISADSALEMDAIQVAQVCLAPGETFYQQLLAAAAPQSDNPVERLQAARQFDSPNNDLLADDFSIVRYTAASRLIDAILAGRFDDAPFNPPYSLPHNDEQDLAVKMKQLAETSPDVRLEAARQMLLQSPGFRYWMLKVSSEKAGPLARLLGDLDVKLTFQATFGGDLELSDQQMEQLSRPSMFVKTLLSLPDHQLVDLLAAGAATEPNSPEDRKLLTEWLAKQIRTAAWDLRLVTLVEAHNQLTGEWGVDRQMFADFFINRGLVLSHFTNVARALAEDAGTANQMVQWIHRRIEQRAVTVLDIQDELEWLAEHAGSLAPWLADLLVHTDGGRYDACVHDEVSDAKVISLCMRILDRPANRQGLRQAAEILLANLAEDDAHPLVRAQAIIFNLEEIAIGEPGDLADRVGTLLLKVMRQPERHLSKPDHARALSGFAAALLARLGAHPEELTQEALHRITGPAEDVHTAAHLLALQGAGAPHLLRQIAAREESDLGQWRLTAALLALEEMTDPQRRRAKSRFSVDQVERKFFGSTPSRKFDKRPDHWRSRRRDDVRQELAKHESLLTDVLKTSRDPTIRATTLQLLNRFDAREKRTFEVVLKCMDEEGVTQPLAIAAAATLAGRDQHFDARIRGRAIDKIGACLTSPVDEVAACAARALGQLGWRSFAHLETMVDAVKSRSDQSGVDLLDAVKVVALATGKRAPDMTFAQRRGAARQLERALALLDTAALSAAFSDDDARRQFRASIENARANVDPGWFPAAWRPYAWAAGAAALGWLALAVVNGLLLFHRPLWILPLCDLLRCDVDLPVLKVAARLDLLLLIGFFRFHPRVLDAWVAQHADRVKDALERSQTFSRRSIHVPLPVSIVFAGERTTINDPSVEHFKRHFSSDIAHVLIHGDGGAGKTSLACQFARWALAAKCEERLSPRRMLPVLLQDTFAPQQPVAPAFSETPVYEGQNDNRQLLDCIAGKLKDMTGAAEAPCDELVEQLTRTGRVLLIVDRFSELDASSRRMIKLSRKDFPARSVVVTSRREDDAAALDGANLAAICPQLVSASQLSKFSEDYLRIRGAHRRFDPTDVGSRCLKLQEMSTTGGVTVLLARMYWEHLLAQQRGREQNSAHQPTESLEPSSIAEMMLWCLHWHNPKNRGGDVQIADAELERAAGQIAWWSLKESFVPESLRRDEARGALGEKAGVVDELNHYGVLRSVGWGERQIIFSLDPLAEHLAAAHVLDEARRSPSLIDEILTKARRFDPLATRGFLRALCECGSRSEGDVKRMIEEIETLLDADGIRAVGTDGVVHHFADGK